MTDNEIASALLSDYHLVGWLSTHDVAESLGLHPDDVWRAYWQIIANDLQRRASGRRRFDDIESVKVCKLSWP